MMGVSYDSHIRMRVRYDSHIRIMRVRYDSHIQMRVRYDSHIRKRQNAKQVALKRPEGSHSSHTMEYDLFIKSRLASHTLTLGPYVVQSWSRNTPKNSPNETLVLHRVGGFKENAEEHVLLMIQ